MLTLLTWWGSAMGCAAIYALWFGWLTLVVLGPPIGFLIFLTFLQTACMWTEPKE